MIIDMKDLKPGYVFATDEVYFDVYRDGKPVAHIRRPSVMDRDKRWYVAVYAEDFTIKAQTMTYTPVVTTRKMILGANHVYAK